MRERNREGVNYFIEYKSYTFYEERFTYILNPTYKEEKGDKKTLQNEMRGIGVVYQDKYAVEETFQLLKIPREWYDSSKEYDVVIGRKEDLKSKDVDFNLIDLSEDISAKV
jgi:hypothetical protein